MSDADDLVAKIRAIADEVEGTATSVTERAPVSYTHLTLPTKA